MLKQRETLKPCTAAVKQNKCYRGWGGVVREIGKKKFSKLLLLLENQMKDVVPVFGESETKKAKINK